MLEKSVAIPRHQRLQAGNLVANTWERVQAARGVALRYNQQTRWLLTRPSGVETAQQCGQGWGVRRYNVVKGMRTLMTSIEHACSVQWQLGKRARGTPDDMREWSTGWRFDLYIASLAGIKYALHITHKLQF